MPLTQVQGGMLAGSSNTVTTIQSNNITAVTIDTSQNVGIGTASPSTYSAKLAVVSSSGAANQWLVGGSSAGAYAYFSNNAQSSSTNTMQIGQGWTSGSDNIGFLNTNGANPMLFATNGAERMRIDATGNAWFRSTGSVEPYNATTGSFTKIGDTSYPILATAPNLVCILNRNTSTGVILEFKYNGTAYGSVSTNGSSVTYNTTSDYRLKEAIVPMTGALDKVAQLKPYTYTWKANGESSQGFIAHELAEVYPDVVTGEKDAVDEEGNPTYQAVDYSKLVATLTAAIQELNAKVDAQAAEIAALKAAK